MSCTVVQIDEPRNEGEKEMMNFLSRLPEDEFLVFRELKVDSTFYQKTKGLEQRHPDFVVVGKGIGIVSIEVKDWNLVENQYVWKDQYKIEKTNRHGETVRLDNPVHQSETYLHALKELVGEMKESPWVTSVVAFPRLTWTQFRNQVANEKVFENPQSKFYLDPDRTIFKNEMTDHILNPERVLKRVAQAHSGFSRPSGKAVYQAKDRLLPSSFRIGDYRERQESKETLKMLTEEQREWVFGLDGEEHYLLDVAGSGKTNCLISKALHIVDTADDVGDLHILLTTYSPDLARNVEEIYKHKLASRKEKERYDRSITIKSLRAFRELVLEDAYGADALEEQRADRSIDEYRTWLQTESNEVVGENYERWAVFSHVFVDEVQDLDDQDLMLLSLINRGQQYFFVGDFGQRIYEREQNFETIGIDPDLAELPKTYQMHRTPKYIAKLATRFVTGDRRLAREFEKKGYVQDPEFANPSTRRPELEWQRNPVQATTERIQRLLRGGPSGVVYRPGEIMVITTADRVNDQNEALKAADVPCGAGTESVEVVDFWHAKGLETEVVFVHGIEALYQESKNKALFGGVQAKKKSKRRLRRILYVALTRSLEQLVVYYEDRTLPVIDELLAIAKEIDSE